MATRARLCTVAGQCLAALGISPGRTGDAAPTMPIPAKQLRMTLGPSHMEDKPHRITVVMLLPGTVWKIDSPTPTSNLQRGFEVGEAGNVPTRLVESARVVGRPGRAVFEFTAEHQLESKTVLNMSHRLLYRLATDSRARGTRSESPPPDRRCRTEHLPHTEIQTT